MTKQMALQVLVFAAKPYDLSSIPRTHIWKKKNNFQKMPSELHPCVRARTHTPNIKDITQY